MATSAIAPLLSEFGLYHPLAVINFAAESHLDRSIHGPGEYIQTNILGTFYLLESVRVYRNVLPEERKSALHFLQVY